MEILALLGMPKVQASPNRNNQFASFQVTGDNGWDNALTNTPGATFDVIKATNAAGWNDVVTRLIFIQQFNTLGEVAYDRLVYGWRVVNTKGIVGDNQQCPRMNFFAAAGVSTGYTQAATPVSLTPQLANPEGQYFEMVFDYRTSEIELYLDGMFLTRNRIFVTPQAVNRNMALMVDHYIDNYRPNLSAIEYRGYFRDLYMAGLANDEVFEPTGGIDVTNLDTASITFSGGSASPANIDNWALPGAWTLDTAVTDEHRQVMVDPTPMKDAIAITAMCSNITPAGVAKGYMIARSGGVKIADEMTFRNRTGYNSRFMRIDPSKLGNDLTIAFKVDP